MEITFTHPIYLWAFISVPIVIIVHLITLKYIKGKALEFANFPALTRVAKKTKISRNIGLLIIRIFTLSSIILAVSGTVVHYFGQGSEFDFILAIDASSSMSTDDIEPNRLEAAKESAMLFVDSVPFDTKIGVISFSGTSYVEEAPTKDSSKVKKAINDIKSKRVGGTDLGEAIITASNLLLMEKKAKGVILLTDGRSNVGVSTSEGIDYANDNDVIVNTIGLGTKEGGVIPYTNVTLTIDEEELKKIASETNGKYYKAVDKESLSDAYKEIALSDKKKLSIDTTMGLMLITLILLIIDLVLMNTRYRIIP